MTEPLEGPRFFRRDKRPVDWTWQKDAECRDAPDIFHPSYSKNGRKFYTHEEEAKAYCHRCPVTEECLETALSILPPGIWGGLTEGERRRLKKKMKDEADD